MKKAEKIFTVDVEEFYHAENVLYEVPHGTITGLSSRVDIGVRKLLSMLDKHGSRATFFILGCVAEKNRNLVRDIVAGGHEVASHGYDHIPLSRHTPHSFDEDLGRSITVLSDIIGGSVMGYRAVGFSLRKEAAWFFDILKKYKITYDSSMSLSLFRECSDKIEEDADYCEIERGMLEFPVSFIKIGPISVPLGGGYFRAYPYWLTKLGLTHLHQQDKRPPLFYIHPWELDPEQPRFKLPPVKSFRHYMNLSSTEAKIDRLLSEMRFISIKDYITDSSRI